MATDPEYDVIVVGAGLAGLSAALELTDSGLDVLVLEARNRVGGRTASGTTAEGQWLELGGQWVAESHHLLRALITRFAVQTEPSGVPGRLTQVDGERRVEIDGSAEAADPLTPDERGQVDRAAHAFGEVVESVVIPSPWLTPSAARLDESTFAGWIREMIPSERARVAFLRAVDAMFAPDPVDVSLLHAAYYFATGDHLAALLGHDRESQEKRVTGGASVISDAMAVALGDRVVLDEPVVTIEHGHGVQVTTRSGNRYRARRAIVTLPPPLAGRLDYRPPMPNAREQLTQRLHAISVVKLYLVYDRPFWREDGLSGEGVLLDGPITTVLDNTPVGHARGVLVGFIEGADKLDRALDTPSARRQAFIRAATRLFGDSAQRPIEYIEKDWMAEEFSRGCYSGHFAPGTWTAYGPALTEPVGPLHWAGTETATAWTGYMEGAVQSGIRAARMVAEELLPGVPSAIPSHSAESHSGAPQ